MERRLQCRRPAWMESSGDCAVLFYILKKTFGSSSIQLDLASKSLFFISWSRILLIISTFRLHWTRDGTRNLGWGGLDKWIMKKNLFSFMLGMKKNENCTHLISILCSIFWIYLIILILDLTHKSHNICNY